MADPRHAIARITARAWADPAFKARLLSDPKAVLHEYDIQIPDGVSVVMHESTDAVRHVVHPQPPEGFMPSDISSTDIIVPMASPYETLFRPAWLPRRILDAGGRKGASKAKGAGAQKSGKRGGKKKKR
jgi:hypothetical protein